MRSVLYILGSLSDEDVGWFVGNGEKLPLSAGAPLVVEGESLDAIYIVLEGTLRVHRKGAADSFAELQAGELVGELSLLDSRPPSASVSAVDEAWVLRIPRNRLNAKLETDLGFASRMYRAMGVFLAHRLRQMIQQNARGAGAKSLTDVRDEDEIDPEVLEASALAGTRFQWMLRKLASS